MYVALLRGINVGGRIVKMAELKACFEGMGFGDVKTILQTGNVAFESTEKSTERLKKQIETGLTQTFNYPAKVQVFTAAQLQQIIDENPFKNGAVNKHQYVIFLEV